MGCVSLVATGFCCYMGYLFVKTVKETWPEIRAGNDQRIEDRSSNRLAASSLDDNSHNNSRDIESENRRQ